MEEKPLYVALAISVIVNLVVLAGLATMVASDSASGSIARPLHLVTNDQVPDVRGVSSKVADLSSRVDDLETGGGDQAGESVDDLSSRVDDLETGSGDNAADSVDSLDTRVCDLESRVDDLCFTVESAVC
jgi:outer membrane murein-binding lipoprotein Lpp